MERCGKREALVFGNSTPLIGGERSPNGFAALAMVDDLRAGGNGDGLIDSEDRDFYRLCV